MKSRLSKSQSVFPSSKTGLVQTSAVCRVNISMSGVGSLINRTCDTRSTFTEIRGTASRLLGNTYCLHFYDVQDSMNK